MNATQFEPWSRVLLWLSWGMIVALACLASPGAAAEPQGIEVNKPLRNPSICRGPDGTYYLTGSVAIQNGQDGKPDFYNNDGVYLWKSPDRKQWEFVGQVWSIEKDVPQDSWQRRPAKQRGMTAPKVHYLKGTFWIPYSMNGRGFGLLRSKTGKAAGPYEDLGQITSECTGASLFADDDGSVYWLAGKPGVAGLHALAEEVDSVAHSP